MLKSSGSMELSKSTFSIKPLREEDIPDTVRLEESCGLSSRQEAGYRRALRQSHEILLTASTDHSPAQPRLLVGLFSGAVVVDELQIDNVVVAESYRHCGLASRLLTAALRLAQQRGATSAVLEVRAQNLAARALYQKHGFTIAGVRKAYYQQPLDDALLLFCDLSKGTENAP